MKKINLYIATALLLITGACGDSFLDADPKTTLTDENFYKTPADAYKALVGCYDGLQIVWADGVSFPVASEVLSDNAFGGTGSNDGYGYQLLDEFDKERSPSDQNIFERNWEAYYKAIFRCNVLLSKLDQINWGSDLAYRTKIEAETKFIRAYLYFDMVRLWEKVPLVTVVTTENLTQADPDDVYTLIAEDLKFAADNLTEVTYSAQPVGERGRVTKWAASALLARVYLFYTGYYDQTDLVGVVSQADVLAYLENTITKSGHNLVSDFAKLWPAASVNDYVGEDNIETVFGIKYTFTSDYDGNTDGNHWMVMYGIREQSSYPYGNGWGGATVNAKLWNAFSDSDTRKVASIISINGEEIELDESKQREYTGFYNKKYSPMIYEDGTSIPDSLSGGGGFMITQFQDYVSIRYADVLLMAAELGSVNAQTYFDRILERAYGDNFTPTPATKDNIMVERRFEFVGEGIRYWDLLRQGVDVAADAIKEDAELMDGTEKVIEENNILTTRGFQQVPNNQITLSSGVLKQNTGW